MYVRCTHTELSQIKCKMLQDQVAVKQKQWLEKTQGAKNCLEFKPCFACEGEGCQTTVKLAFPTADWNKYAVYIQIYVGEE